MYAMLGFDWCVMETTVSFLSRIRSMQIEKCVLFAFFITCLLVLVSHYILLVTQMFYVLLLSYSHDGTMLVLCHKKKGPYDARLLRRTFTQRGQTVHLRVGAKPRMYTVGDIGIWL